jgi:hypothetical protein
LTDSLLSVEIAVIEPRGVVGFRVILDAYCAAGMAAMGPVSPLGLSCAMEPSDR